MKKYLKAQYHSIILAIKRLIKYRLLCSKITHMYNFIYNYNKIMIYIQFTNQVQFFLTQSNV